jgi:hypothetical protein
LNLRFGSLTAVYSNYLNSKIFSPEIYL